MADFNKVGFLAFDDAQRILMCRKDHFTSRLILPGGRIEGDETDDECLRRELAEELGEVTPLEVSFVGVYRDMAHSDDPSVKKTLELRLYRGILRGKPSPRSEITELVWFGKDSDPGELTPIFSNHILPDLQRRGIVAW